MADTGWIVVSGEGSQLIDGGTIHDVQDIWVVIESVTSARVRILGATAPRRVQYAGSVGWSVIEPDRSSTNVPFVTYDCHINFEFQDCPPFQQASSNVMAADSIWWKFPPGVSAAIRGWYL